MFDVSLFINGSTVAGTNGVTYERRDPLSDTVVTRASAATPDDARRAANAAAAAFDDWADSTAEFRAGILMRAAEIFEARVDEVVAIARQEIGSSEKWIRFNVQIATEILRHAAELTQDPSLVEQEIDSRRDGLSYLRRRRAAGVVLGIAPWNAAVTLATRAIATPLACGNTVVLKASELCPKTHEWVMRALNDAGLPEGVLNFITNAPESAAEVVETLIAHPAIRRVNFTGSTRVGREIAQIAARHLKPCLLELSGKGTMIVLGDADLDEAATAAVHGAFFNQGQICMSTERLVVVDAVADEFVTRFSARTATLRGKASKSAQGRLINAQAALRLRGLVDDAMSKGATLVTGGDVFNTTMAPTILDNVSPDMRIYAEEGFGPIAAIIRVSDAEEALSVANDTEFGLAAAVFSTDTAAATEMLRHIECGIGHVNGSTVYDDPRMPFGGVKSSGYGRFGGSDAIHEFTDLQWITIRGEPGGN